MKNTMIDRSKTALVVIDLQKGVVGRQTAPHASFRRRGITTMILCGISTNIGVESTARFAYEYGYNQVFAEDAMSALSAEEHALTVTKIFPRICLVRKTGDILADLAHD